MTENSQDELARAYSTLQALRKNIDNITYGVRDTYVAEFHKVLDKLDAVGVETTEFRIPEPLVKPQVTVVTMGGPRYSAEKYVEKAFILTKIDAVLGYFEIITSEKPKRIGFRTFQE